MQTAERVDINQLYANYKRTSEDEIDDLLERILLVTKTNKGVGSVFGYYKLGDKLMKKIKKNARGTSHTFETSDVGDLVEGLQEMKTIHFLVKSSSRFFLKPDIGEVFDQMSEEDKRECKAIYTDANSVVEISGTSGEHFVLKAVLLK